MTEGPWGLSRERLAWWVVVFALAGVLAFVAWRIVGTVVMGLFVYYGARPMFRRLHERVDSRGLAAAATLLLIVVPTIALLSYAGLMAWSEFTRVAGDGATQFVLQRLPGDQQSLGAILRSPMEFLGRLDRLPSVQQGVNAVLTTLGTISTGLLHLGLALTFAFFLYSDGHRLHGWVREEWGEHSTTYAALSAADRDLEVVYFGNVLTVAAVTVLALGLYNGFAYVAPQGLTMPFPTLLAILTGLATFVPVVVGKVVYLPTAAYLFYQAWQAGNGAAALWWPAAFLVAAFLLLDILPMTFIRGKFSGQTIHDGMAMLSYILGATVFGWYGLFLGPLFLVGVVQAANVVLPELIDGRDPLPRAVGSTSLGTDPSEAGLDVAGAEADDIRDEEDAERIGDARAAEEAGDGAQAAEEAGDGTPPDSSPRDGTPGGDG
ncbi:AI-2E family transporter [Halobium salinum]|uniref:AI-2E family transporter n=1 Tax=Halobium salinum TaxID=1364940 RepID=A0ABD5PCR3_9EURY|nr:AI-2E family transporter [Halobium salinum]